LIVLFCPQYINMWWITKTGRHQVNLTYGHVQLLQNDGCKFCYLKDNNELRDKLNKNNSVDLKNVSVKNSDGETIRGEIIHMVNGETYGTTEKYWFIIKPILNQV
jgi:hypothetical protein